MPFDRTLPDLPSLSAIAETRLQRRGRRWTPCPKCGTERLRDGRAPLAIYPGADGERWTCHAGGCGAGGDAIALLAILRFGEVPRRGDPRWRELFADLRGSRTPRINSARASQPPDPREVADLWAACKPLSAVDVPDGGRPVRDWIGRYRSVDIAAVERLDLARIMPSSYPWPLFLPSLGLSRDSFLSVYRIAVPVYDADGRLAALRFRAVDRVRQATLDGERPTWVAPLGFRVEERDGKAQLVATVDGRSQVLPKSVASRGAGAAAGFVMADPMARALLRGDREDDGVTWDGTVAVVEGEPDVWTLATAPDRLTVGVDAVSTMATLGIESGSWTAAIADRIPDGARVVVWTNHDKDGNESAATVADSLAHRCTVDRVAPWSTCGGAE